MKKGCYENYPLWMVILTNIHPISIYILGAFILSGLGIIFTILYLLFCLCMEIRLLKSCVNCHYYGKTCAFGKGRLSALLFKRGDPDLFYQEDITWYAVLPDFLVLLFPLAGGIILIISSFNWITLLLIISILILSLAGNAFIRSLTCKYCRQRELGCSAFELFSDNE